MAIKTDKLPSWAFGIIAVATTAAVIVIGIKIYNKFKKVAENKDTKKVADDSKNELNRLAKQGDKLSFPDASYGAAANTIKNLLDGCERVTSEIQVVNEVAKVVKKPIDWYKLVSVFGNRDVADCGYGRTNYDLIGLLKDQLDTTLMGDAVLGKRYWNEDSLVPLTEYLSKLGITI